MNTRVTSADLARIAPLLATAVIMLVANGLQGTLVPVRAHYEGFSSTAISFMGAAYFAGFVVGCMLCPRLIHRVGHIRTFAVLGAITGAIVLGHALVVGPIVWGVFRAGIGFCAAGMFAVLEGWLNQSAGNAIRGRIFTMYATFNNLALLGGQYLFTLEDARSHILFSLCTILTLLCLIPVGVTTQAEPQRAGVARLRLLRLYRLSPVGVIGAIAVGLTSGAFWTLAPVYAEARGLSGDGVALFMSMVILGGAIAQWPLGRLSDFTDRRLIIGVATAAASIAGLMLAVAAPFGIEAQTWLLAGGMLYGATAFPIGSLTNAHLNDHARQEEMTEFASSNLFVYGTAAAIGPIVAAGVIYVGGISAIFFYTAAMHASLVGFVLYRILVRAPIPTAGREPFEVEPVQPAPMHMAPEPVAAKG
ncbi:MAG: MFS transporter [Alphaproteobacteria bacterium]|nr:MFS transporter [Alphaproteobacteria bacterium]